MNHEQYSKWLNDLLFTAGMNIEYHQIMGWWYWFGEFIANILMITLVILGLVMASKKAFGNRSLWLGVGSAIFGCVLLTLPIGSWRTQEAVFVCDWSYLYGDLSNLDESFKQLDKTKELTDYFVDMRKQIEFKKSQIQGQEYAPWSCVLERCNKDQRRRWGYGEEDKTNKQTKRSDIIQSKISSLPNTTSRQN